MRFVEDYLGKHPSKSTSHLNLFLERYNGMLCGAALSVFLGSAWYRDLLAIIVAAAFSTVKIRFRSLICCYIEMKKLDFYRCIRKSACSKVWCSSIHIALQHLCFNDW